MNYILKYISRCTLYIIGWKPIQIQLINFIKHHHKVVAVFSHTSYFDFGIMVLYKLAYPEQLNNLMTLINFDFCTTSIYHLFHLNWVYDTTTFKTSKIFKNVAWLLTQVGGIPSSCHDEQGGVNRIVNTLKQQNQCLFLISPKGSILRKEWKTGYYHIAKQMDAPIMAIGLDYEQKCIKMGNLISNQLDEPIVKNLLYRDLSTIVPLHPKQENMTIRSHQSNQVSVVNAWRMLGFSFICLIPTVYWFIK
jgi:hypothetical protein